MGKLRDQTERRHGEPARRGFTTAGERLLAEGEARGEAKGRSEQARRTLERQLVQKFGALPQAVLTRLSVAALEELEGGLDRVMEADSPEDVFDK